MKKYINCAIIFFILLNYSTVYSQKKEYRKAEILVENGNFRSAVSIYLDLYKETPKNSNLNFLIGYCYLSISEKKIESIEYLEKSIEYLGVDIDNDAPLESYYHLGRAYHNNHKFDKAISIYEKLLPKVPKYMNDLLKATNRQVSISNNAIEVMQYKIDIKVTNIPNLNSQYSDHSPLTDKDESILIFTSKRAGNVGGLKDYNNEYYEDIYISYKKAGKWAKPQNIGTNINTKKHEAAVSLSLDGNQLFIYRADEGNGSIFVSERKNDSIWNIPIKLGTNINTTKRETHASTSPDGNLLFFTSDREGGYGGLDIYISKKTSTGTWGEARNMGPLINTQYDEESPFLHSSGTLFFSSKGHNSIGGFDIFSTIKSTDNLWLEPYNLGYPINTVNDDFFYIPTIKGDKAYYSSIRKGGNGNSDIYQIESIKTNKADVAAISGTIKLENNKSIKIIALDNNKDTVGVYSPNIKTGKYLIILKSGKKYNLHYKADGYITHISNVIIETSATYLTMQQIVRMKKIELKKVGSENTPTDEENYIYSIHILTVNKKLNIKTFKNIKGMRVRIGSDGKYNYYFGEYRYDWEAQIEVRKVLNKYPETFIFINDFDN